MEVNNWWPHDALESITVPCLKRIHLAGGRDYTPLHLDRHNDRIRPPPVIHGTGTYEEGSCPSETGTMVSQRHLWNSCR